MFISLHFYSKNLHDVSEAGDDEGGGCGLFVFRVAVEEEGIKARGHCTHDICLQIVANHQGGITLGTRPLKGILKKLR